MERSWAIARSRWIGIALLSVYGVALGALTLTSMGRGGIIGPLFRWIGRTFPAVTFEQMEVVGNVLLFVPLGLAIALLLGSQRYLVLPIALITSFAIEAAQAVFLASRVPSTADVIANTVGACCGLLLVVVIEFVCRRHQMPV